MPFVVGTAGHIDHGKTRLVRILTGQDTDRLAEEKARGISIDLGFAHLDLADGTQVGIIDVPGHERFIRNMVAGVHGIDLVLMVVAADDGVMPQTEEHFQILETLGVEAAIFVISKTDLVAAQRIAEVEEEIEMLVEGTALQGAPVLGVSCLSGDGIEALVGRLSEDLAAIHKVAPRGYFRLPIDRVFSIHGHGRVITGTALSGEVAIGDEVFIAPGGETYRVRGIQVHDQAVEKAGSGQRVAINLAGSDKAKVERGDIACDPRIARLSQRFDVELELGNALADGLKNYQRVRLHIGTAERHAKVIVLGGDAVMPPSSSRFCQIVSDTPVHVMRGDGFIIRDETARKTLGGGRILDPWAAKHRRADAAVIGRLEVIGRGDPLEIIERCLDDAPALAMTGLDIARFLNVGEADAVDMLGRISTIDETIINDLSWYATEKNRAARIASIAATLGAYHAEQPLEPGMGLEELRQKSAAGAAVIEAKLFRTVIDGEVSRGALVVTGGGVALAAHRPKLDDDQAQAAEIVLKRLRDQPLAPPSLSDILATENIAAGVGKAVVKTLERQALVIRLGPDMLFAGEAMEAARAQLDHHFTGNAEISAAEFRDILATTRKFALALLEHFDKTGVTVRLGDIRKSGKR